MNTKKLAIRYAIVRVIRQRDVIVGKGTTQVNARKRSRKVLGQKDCPLLKRDFAI